MRLDILRGALAACGLLSPHAVGQNNVLLVTMDDIGVDGIAVYKEGATPAPTPTLTALAGRGVLFRNAYATPACTSTRATIHTGRFGFRTGIGSAGGSLPLSETALPEILPTTYANALLGKWHMGNGVSGPNLTGWKHFSGSLANLSSYTSWTKTVNGQSSTSTVYATTDTVNDAITWIKAQTKPWVLCLNFHAPHTPLHAPPSSLHTYRLSGNPRRSAILHYKAMVQAMDTELGRLLTQVGSTTVAKTNIIVIGDNGTSSNILEAPFVGSGKFSVYEAGINVPWIVAGPAVKSPGREVVAFVHSVDLFHTVAELAGVDARSKVPANVELDGISIVPYLTSANQAPLRQFLYGEYFGRRVTDAQSVRNERYKILLEAGSALKLFDLKLDPHERTDLMARTLTATELYNLEVLKAELARVKSGASWFSFGTGCAGKAGIPTLSTVASDRPVSGQTFTTQLGNLHSSVSQCVGILGFRRIDLDLSPYKVSCVLHTPLDILQPLSVVAGSATWAVPVPADPSVFGLRFVQQGIVFESGVNVHNAILTNAGEGWIERK